MKFSFFNCTSVSQIIQEEYFPLTVLWGEQDELVRHYGIHYKNSSLLEFSTGWENNRAQKLVLTLSQDYCSVSQSMPLPETANEAELHISGSRRMEAEILQTIVYTDGVVIRLNDGLTMAAYKCGKIYFLIGAEGKLLSICIGHMTVDEVVHVSYELNVQ